MQNQTENPNPCLDNDVQPVVEDELLALHLRKLHDFDCGDLMNVSHGISESGEEKDKAASGNFQRERD